jgi:hypothetical protein
MVTMNEEIRRKTMEGWQKPQKDNGRRRAENRATSLLERHNVATAAIPIPDDPIDGAVQTSIPGSLAEMRAIMLDASKPLYRGFDAAEIVLSFALGPEPALGSTPIR